MSLQTCLNEMTKKRQAAGAVVAAYDVLLDALALLKDAAVPSGTESLYTFTTANLGAEAREVLSDDFTAAFNAFDTGNSPALEALRAAMPGVSKDAALDNGWDMWSVFGAELLTTMPSTVSARALIGERLRVHPSKRARNGDGERERNASNAGARVGRAMLGRLCELVAVPAALAALAPERAIWPSSVL